ncbi:hypothetical protein CR513_57574, partial [Mucuna pruriens]
MKKEINSIEKNQTWELMDPPSNKKPIALKWTYKVKVNPKGEVQSNSTGTPEEVELVLEKETNEELVDPTHYRKIVGCLRYLCNTRLDLNFSFGLISRFMQKPRQSHLLVAKRILRCLDERIVSENCSKVKLLVDNKSIIDVANHPASHGRSKHTETRFHFLREQAIRS